MVRVIILSWFGAFAARGIVARIFVSLSIAVLVIGSSGCEIHTTVRLEGSNPPTFSLHGSGRLTEVRIYSSKEGEFGSLYDDSAVLWSIVAETPPGGYLRDVPAIVYGTVPKGYRQIVPEDSVRPLPLEEGVLYRYWFVTANAPGALAEFTIRDGRPIVTKSIE